MQAGCTEMEVYVYAPLGAWNIVQTGMLHQENFVLLLALLKAFTLATVEVEVL